jgi:predicted GNAT family acetyltransferase
MEKMALKQLSVDDVAAEFWGIVERDLFDYFFFIYDWRLARNRTQIFLAMKEKAIVGSMLIYDGNIVQLRGDNEAVKFLLCDLASEKIDVQVPVECENMLIEKYPHFNLKKKITLMNLKKGQEQANTNINPQPLHVTDAEAVAHLMHTCYPEMWSGISEQNISALINAPQAVWLGVKVAGELATFGYATKTPLVSHITWIATNPKHQRRGYATSIINSLLKEILTFSEAALIYVVEDNEVAKHIYTKAGFKPYKHYIFIKT